MSGLTAVSWAKANEIRVEALQRLTETADHGCEAASIRAFEEGRLATLEQIRQRRLDLDGALGTPKLRGSVDDEPIVRRTSVG